MMEEENEKKRILRIMMKKNAFLLVQRKIKTIFADGTK